MYFYIVTNKRDKTDKIVFLLDKDTPVPKSPKGYRKNRNNKSNYISNCTKEEVERLKKFYTKVIDRRCTK